MAGQSIDPRTPVLIGYGQVNQHDDHPGVEPVDLMVAAARAAADPRVLEAVDSVRVVNVLSWRYRDPGLLVAQRLRAKNAATRYTRVGGNVPQMLVNQAALDILEVNAFCRQLEKIGRRVGAAGTSHFGWKILDGY